MSSNENRRKKGPTPEQVAFGNEILGNLQKVLAQDEVTQQRLQEIAEARAHAEAHPEEFSFFKDAKQLAEEIQGKVIRTDDGVEVRILRAEGFPANEIAMPQLFGAAMDSMPGTVTAVNHRGHKYPNITADDRGLVLPRVFEVSRDGGPAVVHTKPVRLAEALGLSMGEARTIRVMDSVSGEMRLNPRQVVPQEPQK